MKKLRFLSALLAIVLVIGSAFTSKQHTFTYKYEYVSDDGTNYTLGEDVSGQVPSQTTYKCDFGSDPCTISTDTPKDENNQILMEDGTSEDGDGVFGH